MIADDGPGPHPELTSKPPTSSYRCSPLQFTLFVKNWMLHPKSPHQHQKMPYVFTDQPRSQGCPSLNCPMQNPARWKLASFPCTTATAHRYNPIPLIPVAENSIRCPCPQSAISIRRFAHVSYPSFQPFPWTFPPNTHKRAPSPEHYLSTPASSGLLVIPILRIYKTWPIHFQPPSTPLSLCMPQTFRSI